MVVICFARKSEKIAKNADDFHFQLGRARFRAFSCLKPIDLILRIMVNRSKIYHSD